MKTRFLFTPLLVLTLVLSACNPSQVTPPDVEDPVDTNLITEALVNGYDGEDETVYFLTRDANGEEARFEAGFIKDGKLTIPGEEPPAELQQSWLGTLPENATEVEYGEAAEQALTVHVTAILIGDTGLMITGSSDGVTPTTDGNVPAEMTGLTWTGETFHANWHLPPSPDTKNPMQISAAYAAWVAYGQTGASQSTTMDPAGFMFSSSAYEPAGGGKPGLPHPFNPPAPENPEEPEEPEGPAEIQAVITASSSTAKVNEEITFTAENSTGEGQLTYAWTFGDDTETSSEAAPQHSYAEPGEYTVTLLVTDEADQEDTDTFTITITITPNLPVGYQITDYAGVATEVHSYMAFNHTGVPALELASISSEGWLEFHYDTPLPPGALQNIAEITDWCDEYNPDAERCTTPIFPPGSYSDAEANIILLQGLLVPDPVTGQVGLLSSTEPMTRYEDWYKAEASALFMYADRPVTITLTADLLDPIHSMPLIDVELHEGWNFVIHIMDYDIHYNGEIRNGDHTEFQAYWAPDPAELLLTETGPLILDNGETYQLDKPRIHYTDGTSHEVTEDQWLYWNTSHASVATIDENGRVTAHSGGTTTITAYSMGMFATLEVTVGPRISNPPDTRVQIFAAHPVGKPPTMETHFLGYIHPEGGLIFHSTQPATSPITDNVMIPSELPDNPNAKVAFISDLQDGMAGRIWIGDTINIDGTVNETFTTGELWYSDQRVTIRTEGQADPHEHEYDVMLQPGWNFIIHSLKQTLEDGTPHSFYFENATHFGQLEWKYEVPTHLIINKGQERIQHDYAPSDNTFYSLHVHLGYPSGWGPVLNSDQLIWTSTDESVAIPESDGTGFRITGTGRATITVTDPILGVSGSITVESELPAG